MATYSVVEFLNRDKRTVDALVDLRFVEVAKDANEIDQLLGKFMPMKSYPSRKLLILRFKSYPTIGYLVGVDGEIPIDSPRVQLNEEILGNLKLAKSRGYLEADFEAMRELNLYMNSAGGGAAAATQALSDYYMGQPAELVDGVELLATMLAMRVAVTGKCQYTDPLTGVVAELDYTGQIPAKKTDAPLAQLPAALTGNRRWSQLATATGIQDIVDHLNSYYINTELSDYPPYVVMHRSQFMALQQQASTKLLTAGLRGILTNSTDVPSVAGIRPPTPDEMNQLISEALVTQGGGQTSVQIIIFDKKYYVKDAAGNITSQEFLPKDYYFFATEAMLERAFVPTTEKDFEDGLFTLNEIVSMAPRKERSVVIGCYVPFLRDARLIASRNTENTAIS